MAAKHYERLWMTLERSAESTDDLRVQIMTRLFADHGIDDTATVTAVSHAYEQVRRESGVVPYHGINQLLADLKTNYKLGLLTNGPSEMQWEKIEALGFAQYFDAVIVAGDVGIYKPDVRVFQMLLTRLDVSAEASLFVGDTYEADIVGAHQTGMYSAWIKRTEDTMTDSVQPTFVISDTTSLRGILL